MTAVDIAPASGRHPADGSSAVEPADLGLFDLRSVTLDDLVEHAALMHRTDRKYITEIPTVRALIAELADTHQVLEIAGRRWTSYRTLYFDTPELAACRAHVQKRRRRWKARSRLYVEDELCRIEVKTKDNRGGTQKVMGPSHPDRYGHLDGDELDFVAAQLGAEHPEVDPGSLTPAAEISYTRATLTDLKLGTRVTIDWNLHCRLEAGDVWLDPDYALIETKGPSTLSAADRALNHLGSRPRSFSKYAAAASILQDNIADNDTRYLQGRVLHHVIVH